MLGVQVRDGGLHLTLCLAGYHDMHDFGVWALHLGERMEEWMGIRKELIPVIFPAEPESNFGRVLLLFCVSYLAMIFL